MEDTVIFGSTNQQVGETTPPQPSQTPQVPPSPPPPSAPPPPPSPALEQPEEPPDYPPPQQSILRRLLKIVIPIVVVILLIFLAITFVLPLLRNSGVGGGGVVAITYWGLWEPKEVMQPIIDEFQKENPNIKVTYEMRDIKKYKETLLTRINSGSGPDVFRFHNSWTQTMKEALSPLPEAVISADEFKKQYYPVVQSDMTINGGVYGIPLHMDTLALFVNDGILEDYGISVPQTWEEFTKVSSAVTVRDESGQMHTYGAAIGSWDNIVRAPDLVSVLFAQNRVNLKKPQDSAVQNYAEALRFYTDFATGRDSIAKVWDADALPALEAFAGGNVALYFGYSWDIFQIKQISPDFVFSVHPVPYLVNPTTVASYWASGVSSKSKHQKEAMSFMQFLAKKETQQKLYTLEAKSRLFGELPARRDLAETLKDNELVYPFLVQAETAVSSYFVSDTHDASINEELNGYLANTVRSILGNTSAESAAQTLLNGIKQVIEKYGLN
ncbi:MAG: extracellular solute-binding protein [Candidatus Levybacteria bacterium]|nr:extracellular solute-binding protein [Candidatus Levybacteria bacterium]